MSTFLEKEKKKALRSKQNEWYIEARKIDSWTPTIESRQNAQTIVTLNHLITEPSNKQAIKTQTDRNNIWGLKFTEENSAKT